MTLRMKLLSRLYVCDGGRVLGFVQSGVFGSGDFYFPVQKCDIGSSEPKGLGIG